MKTSITKIFTKEKDGYAGFHPANKKSKNIRMKIYMKWGLFLFILVTATTSCSKC